MLTLLLNRRRRWTIYKGILLCGVCLALVFWFRGSRNSSDYISLHRKQANEDNNVRTSGKELDREQFHELKGSVERLKVKNRYEHVSEGQLRPPYEVQKPPFKNMLLSDGIMKVVPGLGEGGVAVHLDKDEQKIASETFKEAAFNVYISNRISLNRSVPDARHPLCADIKYDDQLPTASVIIIFTNEMWSTLLRTIWSVINRTPSHLLKEIILVDDFSDRPELKRKLDNYLNENFPNGNVKLIRFPKRDGLIRARLAGAKTATADVLVFLDSHCEVNIQWLEPLLQRIKDKPRNVVCPIIDIVDDNTFEYQTNKGSYFQIGGFTWQGHFEWIDVPPWEIERRNNRVGPTRSPTMAGGLFAVDRKFFWEIGGYDSGMDIWGGENLEMSFRVWMCGSELEILPCSHVGHVFRQFHPYTFPGNKDNHGINTVRAIEVWMDDYKKYIYMNRPDLENVDYGDISERLKLRKKLHCKTFSWYLNNIYPEKFVWDKNVTGFGTVRNPLTNLCLDTLSNDENLPYELGLGYCKISKTPKIQQWFSFSKNNNLRREETCAEIMDPSDTEVTMTKCQSGRESQVWIHSKGGPIIHKVTRKCLEVRGGKIGGSVKLSKCHGGHSQIWWFEKYTDIEIKIDAERP